MLLPNEDDLIAAAARDFINQNTPLTLKNFGQVTRHIWKMLAWHRRPQLLLVVRLPAIRWVKRFQNCHPDLSIKPIRSKGQTHIKAVTLPRVDEHIARLQKIMARYRIDAQRCIFNVDDFEVSLEDIGFSKSTLVSTAAKSKGN